MLRKSTLALCFAMTFGVFGVTFAHAVDNDLDTYDSSVDCNDNDASINPGALENVGDQVDQNCDSQEVCYVDADNDGYRTDDDVVSADVDCADSGEALASDPSGDCNDNAYYIYPGSYEGVGDEVDGNCDGQEVCYIDADNDGYSLYYYSVVSTDVDCQDSGEATNTDPGGDCNDGDPAVNPGATEICNDGINNDCSGGTDCADYYCIYQPACLGTTTTTTTTSTTTTTLAYGGLDHFKCYKVKDLRNPRFTAQPDVPLDDQFEDDVVDVVKPSMICAPADKDGSGINDPVNHICCYKITGTKLDPAVGVEITDQFGTLELEASAVKMLCQPCTKELLP